MTTTFNIPGKLLIFVGLLVFAGTAYAQFYRWIDQNGVICYGEIPPADRMPQPVEIYPGPTAAQVQRSRQQIERINQLQRQLWEERQQLAEAREIIQRQQAEKIAQLDKKCNNSRSWLRVLKKSAGKDWWYVDEDGNYNYASSEKRRAMRDKHETFLRENCR